MEKGLINDIINSFNLPCMEADKYSSLALAYVGDGVFDLVIRTIVMSKGNNRTHKLHAITSSMVKASTQAKMIEEIMDLLTEEEMAIYKRGRNSKSPTSAKNASVLDYRKATGLECLIGYLYISNDMDRVYYLIKQGLEKIEDKK